MVKVYLGLGSNLGRREENIRLALSLIGELGIGRIRRVSELIETDPVGGPAGQPEYLNGAAAIETDLPPEALLSALKDVEARVGRLERARWAPREVDLDILLYGEEIVEREGLEIPHPRLAERLFVLEPLAEIAPGAQNPRTGRTVAEELELLREGESG